MRRLALPFALCLVALLAAASAQGVSSVGPGYVASFQIAYDTRHRHRRPLAGRERGGDREDRLHPPVHSGRGADADAVLDDFGGPAPGYPPGKVKLPGEETFSKISAGEELPPGTVIDVSNGTGRLPH